MTELEAQVREAAIKAYHPPGTDRERVALMLNGYHLANLRWLLRHVWAGTLPQWANTGDWNGEVLWAVEQAIKDNAVFVGPPNSDEGEWPLEGWGSATQDAVISAPAVARALEALLPHIYHDSDGDTKLGREMAVKAFLAKLREGGSDG